ncbi:homogentisate 1,2-dioxygenase [Gordonia sp. NPDC003376]
MKNSWIHIARGTVPRQARVGVANLNEEHFSRQGFFGPASMLYHARPPVEPIRREGTIAVRTVPVAGVQLDDESNPHGLPTPIMRNDDLTVSFGRRSTAAPFLLRNIDADTLTFIHEGTGALATEFGVLTYTEGDFLLIPKGVTHRWLPEAPTTSFVVESADPITFTEHQQVGRHAPFDPGVLGVPELVEYDWPQQDEWEVRLKHGDEISSWFYAELPFDLIGWKGDMFPLRLSIDDIRPITSERLHLAPSSWSVFESTGFMCVPFLPMSVVADPEAEELPSRHRNVDSDELILMRRVSGNPVNVIGHFPQGVTHGPTERAAYEAIRQAGMQRMLEGISIDTYKRLEPTAHYLSAFAELPSPTA